MKSVIVNQYTAVVLAPSKKHSAPIHPAKTDSYSKIRTLCLHYSTAPGVKGRTGPLYGLNVKASLLLFELSRNSLTCNGCMDGEGRITGDRKVYDTRVRCGHEG